MTHGGVNRHIAIFVQPFLDLILEGKKTIETRFSKVRCAPHFRIKESDIVYLKKSGGQIYGEVTVGRVEEYVINKDIIDDIRNKYSIEICASADKLFWEKRIDKKYATLIWIKDLKKYDLPIKYSQKGRQGWIFVKENCYDEQLRLNI